MKNALLWVVLLVCMTYTCFGYKTFTGTATCRSCGGTSYYFWHRYWENGSYNPHEKICAACGDYMGAGECLGEDTRCSYPNCTCCKACPDHQDCRIVECPNPNCDYWKCEAGPNHVGYLFKIRFMTL